MRTIRIEPIERPEPTREGWISCADKTPKTPCIACSVYGEISIMRTMVCLIIDGERRVFEGDMLDYINNADNFLKGKKTILDGEEAYLLPTEIMAWMPMPAPFKSDRPGFYEKEKNNGKK